MSVLEKFNHPVETQISLTWFSWEGRASRIEMWVKGIIWFFAFGLLSIIIKDETFDAFIKYDGWLLSFIFSDSCDFSFILVCILLIPFEIEWRLTQIRRFHDLGQSGWLSLVFFVASNVPVIGFYFIVAELILCLLWAGTSGQNKYGEKKKESFIIKRKGDSTITNPGAPIDEEPKKESINNNIVKSSPLHGKIHKTNVNNELNSESEVEYKLKMLVEKKEKGVITEEEFKELRRGIIDQI